MNEFDSMSYEKCEKCWHFVTDNPSREWSGDVVEYIHLDDGEVEHDHDAVPGASRTLVWWKTFHPELFEVYPDKKTGPNSAYFRLAVRIQNLYGLHIGIPEILHVIIKTLSLHPQRNGSEV